MPNLLNITTDYFLHEATKWNSVSGSCCKLNYNGLVLSGQRRGILLTTMIYRYPALFRSSGTVAVFLFNLDRPG